MHLFQASVGGALVKAKVEDPGDRCSLSAAGYQLLWPSSNWNIQCGPLQHPQLSLGENGVLTSDW